MLFKLEPRTPTFALQAASSAGAVLATVLASGLLFAIMGFPALRALASFYLQPLSSLNGWGEIALKAAPLAMIATGLALGFRANVWNIGAEGQLIMGAVAGGGAALALADARGFWVLPVVCAAGIAGGAGWSFLPALLRTQFRVSEILSSLMLTYVASLFLSLLLFGPWRDPLGYNLPQSPMFSDAASLPPLLRHARVTAGTVIEFAVPCVFAFVLRMTLAGFRIRVAGAAPQAASYAGFDQTRTVWTVLLVSGGLAGLAGVFEIVGPIGQLVTQITPGYGFTAVIVAFLGRLEPLAIIPASLLVALSYIGGDAAQVAVGIPKSAAGVVQGLLLFFPLAADMLARNRVRIAA